MEKIHHPLRTNIGYFFNKPIGFFRDFEMENPEVFIEPDLQLYNLSGRYTFSRTREGLLLQATFEAEVDSQCNRCLDPFRAKLSTKFEELYIFESRTQEEFDDEEVVPEDGYIDLGRPIRDYLLLDLPINLVCKPDCKGICVECGVNLNRETCEHTDSRIIFD
jgi:uncharacterized protein